MLHRLCAAAADAVWGPATVILMLAAGIYFTVGTGGFQLLGGRIWLRATLFSLFRPRESADPKALSPFQSLTVALAGTMGTGNIVGVAAAITTGGAGAIFWMWMAAFFGMMTAYAENVLGIIHRRKTPQGEWNGGAMMYIEHGLKCRGAAVLYAVLCMTAALGMGNIVQINSVSQAMNDAFSVPPVITGIVAAVMTGTVLIGGLKRVASFTEKLIPALSVIYIAACLAVITAFLPRLPAAFIEIFKSAFSTKAVGGGVLGAALTGIRRGVATNEAGLGSSVMVHSCADVEHPSEQGMWGMFEVFVDTIVVCTLTALAILVSGANDGTADGAVLSARAFEPVFGSFASPFIAVSIALFAFSTLIGWSCYGERCFIYLFGEKSVLIYRLVFSAAVVLGSVMRIQLAWDISDVLNGLMALVNVPALLLLSPQVFRETRELRVRYAA